MILQTFFFINKQYILTIIPTENIGKFLTITKYVLRFINGLYIRRIVSRMFSQPLFETREKNCVSRMPLDNELKAS